MDGQGSARNLALDNAKGQYVCFVDSDDSVKTDYVEFLYNLLNEKKLDIAACNFEIYNENGTLIKKKHDGSGYCEFSNIEAINSIWYSEILNIGPWAKLYKKSLWNNVRFEECFSEDFATMHKIYILANKVGYSYECKLNYLVRGDSAIHAFQENKIQMLKIADDNIKFSEQYHELENAAYSKAISVYFHVLLQLPDNTEYRNIKKEIIEFIKNNRKKVLKDKRNSYKIRFAIIISYFGFNTVKILLNLIKKKNVAF